MNIGIALFLYFGILGAATYRAWCRAHPALPDYGPPPPPKNREEDIEDEIMRLGKIFLPR